MKEIYKAAAEAAKSVKEWAGRRKAEALALGLAVIVSVGTVAAVGGIGSPASVVTIPGTLNAAGTSIAKVIAATTTNTLKPLDVSAGKEVALSVKWAFSSAVTAGSSNIVINVYQGVDNGSTTNFAPFKVWTVTGSPTANFYTTTVTNLTVLGIPYLQIQSIANSSDDDDVTNLVIKAFVK